MWGQADELRVRTADWQRSNDLARFEAKDTVAEPVHYANQIPPRREGQPRRLGMNAFAHHDVGQGYTRGQHSHPHFTTLRLRALFFVHLKCFGPAVVTNDNARVLHGPVPPAPASTQRKE